MKDVCKDPFDADFIDRIGDNRQALYDLILAANYMDIKALLHLGCAKVASLIKGIFLGMFSFSFVFFCFLLFGFGVGYAWGMQKDLVCFFCFQSLSFVLSQK